MQKRKFKLNMLDIAIFTVVICAVCILVFRDQIRELSAPPAVVNIEVSVKITDDSFDMSLLEKGSPVRFDSDTGTSELSDALIVSIPQKGAESSDERSLTFVCTGYKKFGLLYTENGDRLQIESDCTVTTDSTSVNAVITSAVTEQNS